MNRCVSLIGMPGAGKTTIGRELAQLLEYAFMDSDYLIESIYGRRLQDITDQLPRNEFLNAEGQVICAIRASACVIATGGSAIYNHKAIAHLKALGPLVYLNLPLEEIKKRISVNPERGISFGPGQSIEDLFEERTVMYKREADIICDTDMGDPAACAQWIRNEIERRNK